MRLLLLLLCVFLYGCGLDPTRAGKLQALRLETQRNLQKIKQFQASNARVEQKRAALYQVTLENNRLKSEIAELERQKADKRAPASVGPR